jgi:hypothetical protein
LVGRQAKYGHIVSAEDAECVRGYCKEITGDILDKIMVLQSKSTISAASLDCNTERLGKDADQARKSPYRVEVGDVDVDVGPKTRFTLVSPSLSAHKKVTVIN